MPWILRRPYAPVLKKVLGAAVVIALIASFFIGARFGKPGFDFEGGAVALVLALLAFVAIYGLLEFVAFIRDKLG